MSWSGSKANIFEKQKVREIASLIRDTERHGKARIIDTSEGEEPEEMLKVGTSHAEHGAESKFCRIWFKAADGNARELFSFFYPSCCCCCCFLRVGPGTDARASTEHAGG